MGRGNDPISVFFLLKEMQLLSQTLTEKIG